MLILAFLFSGVVSFGLVLFLVRPTTEQKAVNRRVVAVKGKAGVARSADDDDVQRLLRTVQPGAFAWIEDLVEGTKFRRTLELMILRADRQTSVGTVMMTCAGLYAGGALVAYWMMRNLPLTATAGAAAAYLPILLLTIRRRRRVNAFNKALPDCVDMMSRSLRAGHSLVAAIDIVASQAVEPARTEFGEVFKKQNYGLPLREALMQLLDRVPSQDLKVLVTGILVQKDTGGNLAEILDRILQVIKERVRLQGEIRTHTAQGRLTGWVLCALPVIMLVLINIVNPGYSSMLFNTPLGQKLLYAGAGLLCLGAFTISKIVKGIEV